MECAATQKKKGHLGNILERGPENENRTKNRGNRVHP